MPTVTGYDFDSVSYSNTNGTQFNANGSITITNTYKTHVEETIAQTVEKEVKDETGADLSASGNFKF